MPTFIKPGFWNIKRKQLAGELNLETLFPSPTLENVVTNGNTITYQADPEQGTTSGMISIIPNYEAYYGTLTLSPTGVELFGGSGIITTVKPGYILSSYKDQFNIINQILLQGGRIRLGNQKTYGAYNVQAEILTDDIVGDKLAGQLDRLQQLTNSEGKIPVYNTKTAPVAANSSGFKGEIRSNASYIFVCIADNTWIRSAITAW